MKWTQVPAGDINAANQRLWVALGDNANNVATHINTDPAFVENIAQFMINGGYQPSTSVLRAILIMGKNFFGIEEAIKHFGVNATKQQLAYLTEVPFSEEVLKSCKDTHVLVAMFPLSILDIRREKGTLFQLHGNWYDTQEFAKDKGKIGWQLVRKEPIANSTSKTWNEQQTLLSENERVPNARIIVYTIIGHFLATGERLFEKIQVRCADLDVVGHRVYVGKFDVRRLRIDGWNDDYRNNNIGLASMKKP